MAIDEKKLIEVLERNFGGIGGASVLKQLIEAQPKISLENKTSDWISVEESLPKEDGWYLVQYDKPLMGNMLIDVVGYDDRGFLGVREVVAWQPLPPKYEGKYER